MRIHQLKHLDKNNDIILLLWHLHSINSFPSWNARKGMNQIRTLFEVWHENCFLRTLPNVAISMSRGKRISVFELFLHSYCTRKFSIERFRYIFLSYRSKQLNHYQLTIHFTFSVSIHFWYNYTYLDKVKYVYNVW